MKPGTIIRLVTTIGIIALSACKPKETTMSGQVFIATSGGQNLRLGDVEVLLVEKKQALEFLESQRTNIETEVASRHRELEAAEAALETARSDHNLSRTPPPYSTNADYLNAKADLDSALQKIESLKEGAQKWRSMNLELKDAARRAVNAGTAQRTAARASGARKTTAQAASAGSDFVTFAELEREASAIFQSSGGMARTGVPKLGRLMPALSGGEIKELAEWRAFLKSALEGLRIISDQRIQKDEEVRSLKQTLERIENAAIAENMQERTESRHEVKSALDRVAAAKSRLEHFPTAETYLGSFRPAADQKTHTDADGAFSLTYPRNKEFVIFARAERSVPLGETEKYYWLVNAPSGTGKLTLQLSNSNLASTDSDGHLQVLGSLNAPN